MDSSNSNSSLTLTSATGADGGFVSPENYREIVTTIGGRARLIAVSKNQPLSAIERLYALGHREFGENYAQELVEKATVATARGLRGIQWHFIGHLQTNKVKAIIPFVSAVHSVDSLKLAQELHKRRGALNKPHPLPIFIEVNIDEESGKAGVRAEATRALCEEIATGCPALRIEGLMCIPAAGDGARAAFERLRDLEATCRPITQGGLSMGMSGDFELAIEAGATHVRVGTKLFGARPPSLDSRDKRAG